MKRVTFKPSLTMLPHAMLMVILSKVAESSHGDLGSCMLVCKMMYEVAKFYGVLRSISVDLICPAPYEAVPTHWKLLQESAFFGNVHAIFLCGLFDYFYLKNVKKGLKSLTKAAKETHQEAMYVYGMILLNKGDIDEGSNYLTQLWKNQGMDMVRQCHINVHKAILEISVREYRDYDMLLGMMIVGEDCEEDDLTEVCDECFIRKELYRFMDYFF